MAHTVRELGGAHVDLFQATQQAEQLARKLVTGGMAASRAQREAARQVVSAALVRAIREGRTEAREALAAMWLDEVFRWCRFHASRGLSAEDMAHDALLRMLTLLPKLHDPDRFRPWLWSVVWRVLKEHQRRSWWRSWVAPAPAPGLEQQVHAAERQALVGRALEALTLEQRGLLFLAYVDGLGRAEIAARLGLAEGTLNRKLTAARQAFADAARALDLDAGAELVELQSGGMARTSEET